MSCPGLRIGAAHYVHSVWKIEVKAHLNHARTEGAKIMIGTRALKKAATWLGNLKRPWGSSPQRLLRVCENVSLGERSSIRVVQFGQETLLLGVSNGAIARLATLSGPGLHGADSGNGAIHNDRTLGDEIPTWRWQDGALNLESKSRKTDRGGGEDEKAVG
jgi:hypothetical protein